MISSLLGEDSWPELESVLHDFATRHNLSKDVIHTVQSIDPKDYPWYVIGGILGALLNDIPRMKADYPCSVNEVLRLIDTHSEPNDPLKRIRSTITLRLFRQSREGNENPSTGNPMLKELAAFREKLSDKSIHQLYLMAKEFPE